jgi:steroid 5-alpha reductase family enzyme
MIDALLVNAAILLVLVLILWAISVRINDVSFIDAFWGAGMGVMAIASFAQVPDPGNLALLLLIMTTAWGFRLGIHLFLRWRQDGEDARYERMLRKDRERGRFAIAALSKVFLGQAVLLFITCLPAQLGILGSAAGAPVTGLAWLGLGVFLLGIFFEWVGDWQLMQFKADPANKGQVMDRGLWRYTRHPNYFGDACAWWGIWLAAASLGWEVAAWSVIGPIFLTFTLTKWSGAPLLEGGMKKRRPEYAAYIERTSGFIPMPPRKTG